MGRRLQKFRHSVARFGLPKTLATYVDGALRRLIPYEVCRVESNYDGAYGWTGAPGYDTRSVTSEEFHGRLCPELAGADYRWAFARGDICIASFSNGEIVGHSFYTRHPTTVSNGVIFEFPSTFVYGFASLTAPSQRGNRLESERWKVSQYVMQELTGENVPRIFYINVLNFASLAANRRADVTNRLVGYSGYARLLGRWCFFRSKGCRAVGAGFLTTEPGARADGRH